jgi:hypothetical protein
VDGYLAYLIKQQIESDTGKLEKYYKNEVNKSGVSREAIIYKFSLGKANLDDLGNALRTEHLPEGKNFIKLLAIKYEIRYNHPQGIDIACIISTLKLVDYDGLTVEGTFDVYANETDLQTKVTRVNSNYSSSPRTAVDNFLYTLDEIIESISNRNNEELSKYRMYIQENLE